MVSLPGWGGRGEHRERLGSNGSEISRNRYNLPHPRVQHTSCKLKFCALPLSLSSMFDPIAIRSFPAREAF